MPITCANAVQNQELSVKARQRSPVKMLNEMQDQLMKAVMDTETEPREKAQCALAWDKLEARKAVLNGLPANTSQSIRPDAAKAKRTSTAAIVLESEPEPVKPSGDETAS